MESIEEDRDGYEKENKIKVPLWPYTTKELALMYKVHVRTMERELNRLSGQLGEKHGHYWWPKQVEHIFNSMWWPYVSEKTWRILKANRGEA